jgi:hypothetical protein
MNGNHNQIEPMDAGNINAVEPDFIVIALKSITGIAVKEEKARLDVLLGNAALCREWQITDRLAG